MYLPYSVRLDNNNNDNNHVVNGINQIIIYIYLEIYFIITRKDVKELEIDYKSLIYKERDLFFLYIYKYILKRIKLLEEETKSRASKKKEREHYISSNV